MEDSSTRNNFEIKSDITVPQIWNVTTGIKVREFAASGYITDLKLCDTGKGRNLLFCLQEESGRGWLVELVDHAMKR